MGAEEKRMGRERKAALYWNCCSDGNQRKHSVSAILSLLPFRTVQKGIRWNVQQRVALASSPKHDNLLTRVGKD